MKKKLLRKMIPLTLAFVLLFGSLTYGAEVNAVTDMQREETVPNVQDMQMVIPEKKEKDLKKTSLKSAASPLKIGYVSSYNKLQSYLNGNNNFSGIQFSKSSTETVLNFKPTKTGNLYIEVISSKTNSGRVYMNQRSSKGKVLNGVCADGIMPGDRVANYIPVQAKTTYQLHFTPVNMNDIFYIRSVVVSGGKSMTLPTSYATGDYTIAAGTNASHNYYTTYWKFKAKSNGRLLVNAEDIYAENNGVYVTLCNSKKKAISETSILKDYEHNGKTYIDSANYGISGTKKGTTYYLKVQTKAPIYILKYTITKYTTKPGTKKSKATKITRGKSKNVTLAASTSTGSQWYKISMPANQKCRISFNGYIAPDTSVKMQILKSNGKTNVQSLKMTGVLHHKNTGYIDLTFSKKGTYYVKISKSSKKSSAAYNISFNNEE